MVKAFGIFEGGGAKGLSHIGALRAAEESNIKFVGLAGASAGSIVASLVAVGYEADELFDPNNQTTPGVFDENFTLLLGKFRWYFLFAIRKFLEFSSKHFWLRIIIACTAVILSVVFVFIILKVLAFLFIWSWFYTFIGTILFLFILLVSLYLGNKFIPIGIFSSTKFEKWLNEKLSDKVFGNSEQIVKFSNIECPLKIIATDIKSRKPIVFSKETHAEYPIAKAVCCSIAIPGVFHPHIEGEMVLIDGGVLSNFPAWVFDQQRREQKEIISTIGFRLHKIVEKSINENWDRNSLFKYLLDLSTVFFGDNFLQIREIEDLHLIPIRVSAKTLDFHMDKTEKRHLYNEGYVAAINFFRQEFTGPKNADEINFILKSLYQEINALINKSNLHLRVNLALPVEPLKQKLRILYSYNMDDDADDRLELEINAGAIGKCWQVGTPILVDMTEARNTFNTQWKMS
jgi:NTE family protein